MHPLTNTTLELTDDGAVVVVKRPASSSGFDRMQREAQIVETARHPGVVDLAASVDPDGNPALVTRWVGPHTLAALESLPLGQAAGIMAALADCVSDLHELGVLHGAITADHVILSPDGRPVLCGFGRSQLVSPDADPAQSAAGDDVAALGRLLRTLTGGEVELEPIPDRRGWRRRPRWQGYQRRALLTLADQATFEVVSLRPTARAFAAAIHDSIPDARLGPVAPPPEIPSAVRPETDRVRAEPGQESPEGGVIIGAGPLPAPGVGRPTDRWVRRRRGAAAFAGLAGLAVLYGLNQFRTPWSTFRATPAASPPRLTAPPSTVREPPSSVPPSHSPHRQRSRPRAPTRRPARRCRSAGPDGADLDADGCLDQVRVTDSSVEAAGIRYRVGATGDRVVVGDWKCDGRATPAVLRPATGEVFLFSSWAGPGREVTVTPTTRVRGASAIRATDSDGDGCSELRVSTDVGRTIVVPVRPGR